MVNGEEWNFGGYIDIGLIDTMVDLLVNFVGALVFSFFGWVYMTGSKKGRFAEWFLLRFKEEAPEMHEEPSVDNAEESDVTQKVT